LRQVERGALEMCVVERGALELRARDAIDATAKPGALERSCARSSKAPWSLAPPSDAPWSCALSKCAFSAHSLVRSARLRIA
jgi:hypothetical protein